MPLTKSGAPIAAWKSAATGIEPPRRMRAVSLPIVSRNAPRRASPHGPSTSHVTGRAGAEYLDVDFHPGGAQLVDAPLESREDRPPVLVRNQSHAHLGPRGGGNDGLLALAREPADDAVGVQRRSAADTLPHRVIRLALERPCTRHLAQRGSVLGVRRPPQGEPLGTRARAPRRRSRESLRVPPGP